MIIVDNALKRRQAEGRPIKVGLIGAGYMGQGIAIQIEKHVIGMHLAAISNRTPNKATQAYLGAGITTSTLVTTAAQLEDAISGSGYAVTDDPMLLCESDSIDVLIEATGDVEFSAHVVARAIENQKHVVLMNAELDATVGPILKVHADRAGVVITNADGDQPGVMMNLLRFVRGIGCRPVLAGNIKGLQDRYRTPETQQKFAEIHHISPKMATSFADGTKISMENAVVANATGFEVGKRGMYGPQCKHVSEVVNLFPTEKMLEKGLVDYILGAEPGPGVFIIGYDDHPVRQDYMKYFKMGDGPFYAFYIPYHLPHLEVPLTAARAVLFGDAAVAPLGRPVCEVVTVAKRDLRKGQKLDGIGGFDTYGVIDNTDVARSESALPMGMSEGCLLLQDIPKDRTIHFDDVRLPGNRLVDELWREQERFFAVEPESL
jgi:predicted homoserine dehydrogenase-like protein